MATDKRQRKKANRAAKLAAEQAAEARQRRFKLIRNAVILAVIILVTLVLLTSCSSDDDTKSVSAGATTVDQTDVPETTVDDSSDEATVETVPALTPEYGSTSCPKFDEVIPEGGSSTIKPKLEFDDAFQLCIGPARSYQATIETTEGTVVVDLDTTRTPLTANNFVALARHKYYDGTEFFRTEAKTGIIQGGSPHTQSNTDPGPGYTIPDEGIPFTDDDYGPGTLAMARTSAPDSASAQFFFLTSEGARYLGDPSQPGAGTYQVFGKVTEGLDVLQVIADLDDGSGVPSQSTSIISVTITEI